MIIDGTHTLNVDADEPCRIGGTPALLLKVHYCLETHTALPWQLGTAYNVVGQTSGAKFHKAEQEGCKQRV